jgi:large subunit ribosomal protein L21
MSVHSGILFPAVDKAAKLGIIYSPGRACALVRHCAIDKFADLEELVYAVVESGGRQYKAIEGKSITVEKLPHGDGDVVELDRVLLISDGDKVKVGQPLIEGAKVKATVLGLEKGPKIRIFKMRPRKRYRLRKGHRQTYTRLHIDEIVAG